MSPREKVELPGVAERTPSPRPKGANGVFEQWEEKLGIKRDDPNFRGLVEHAMANESEADVHSTLMMMGYIPLPPRRKIPLDPDIIPDWLKREN